MFAKADGLAQSVYRHGGFLVFTRPAQAALLLIAVAGVGAFGLTVSAGDAIPFVVSGSVYAGAPVFVAGRFLVVFAHELAHALAVVAVGRHVGRVGLRLVLLFPYAFVDVSEAWFEPRRRRMLTSVAGPASDLTLAGLCSIVALSGGDGLLADVTFQLAVGAYVGALLNLNPLLDRDGYHVLVDVLREPNLRRRSRARLARSLAGAPAKSAEPHSLLIYAIATLVWSLLGVGFAVWLASRYAPALRALTSDAVVWLLLGMLVAALAAPLVVALGRPLFERLRTARAGSATPPRGAA